MHLVLRRLHAPKLITTHLETIDPTFKEITYLLAILTLAS